MSDYFVHETATVDQPVSIGDNTRIWHYTHVMTGAKIGKNCNIGQSVFIGSRAVIGEGVKIQNNVSVYDEVVLEDYVFCGPSVVFTNDINPRAKYPKRGQYIPTKVRYGASLGANSTIVCGIEIGKWAMIGAGSVVTRNIPAYAIVYGNPAQIRGWICECGAKIFFNREKTVCNSCNRQYRQINSKKIEFINQNT